MIEQEIKEETGANKIDTSDFRVVDVLGAGNTGELHAFTNYLKKIRGIRSNERLFRNYLSDRFIIEDQMAIPVVFHVPTGKIFGFSTIFHPPHWPDKTVRVGNRTWIDNEFRVNGANGLAKSQNISVIVMFVKIVFQSHINICRRLDINLSIITREAKGNTLSIMPNLARSISGDNLTWKTDEMGYYQTVPNGQTRDCWQKITYAELVSGARKRLAGINRMTTDMYANRFLK